MKKSRLNKAGYETVADLQAASDEDLKSVSNIGEKTVDAIRNFVQTEYSTPDTRDSSRRGRSGWEEATGSTPSDNMPSSSTGSEGVGGEGSRLSEGRIDELTVEVKDVETGSDSHRDATLVVETRSGDTVEMVVWSKHNISVGWVPGVEYRLEQARCNEWDNREETRYRLHSTEDLSVTVTEEAHGSSATEGSASNEADSTDDEGETSETSGDLVEGILHDMDLEENL